MNELGYCRHGRMLFNTYDKYIGAALKLYGEFSEGEVDVFRQVVRPGFHVVELGANIGAHTIFLARQVGESGWVTAFEPQRIVFQNLCANIAINSLTNVECKQQAVGDTAGTICVPRLDYEHINNFGGLALGSYTDGEIVPKICIDSLDLKACHFIKIDIEGMETEAILGAQKTIERFKPVMYVENDRKDRSRELICTLDGMGYAMYWHLPPMFNPKNFSGNSENIFGNIASINMLCFHRSVPHQLNGLEQVKIPD